MAVFAIERLHPEEKNPDYWIFTLIYPGADNQGFIRSHGWKYIASENQIRRPTARGFAGRLTDLDDESTEQLRKLVKREIMYYGVPIPAKTIRYKLEELINLHQTWEKAYTHVRDTLLENTTDNALTAGQWALLLTLSVLATRPIDVVQQEIEAIENAHSPDV